MNESIRKFRECEYQGEDILLNTIHGLERELFAGSCVNNTLRRKLDNAIKDKRELERRFDKLNESLLMRVKYLFTKKVN